MTNKTIGDKIRINQSLVKNKNVSPKERRNAYLNLKRLNNVLKEGNIVSAKNKDIRDIYNDNRYDIHHLVINGINNGKLVTNTISHTKFRGNNFYSESLKSNVHLKKQSTFRKDKDITKDNVYESKINGLLSKNDFNYIKKNSK